MPNVFARRKRLAKGWSSILSSLTMAALAFCPPVCLSQNAIPEKDWGVDIAVYLVGPRMDGNATVAGISTGVDVPFSKIWENLDSAGMGSVTVRYKRWSLSNDVVYMDLGSQKITDIGSIDVNFKQWIVQPVVQYDATSWISPYAGARDVDLTAGIHGPLALLGEQNQSWWDPVVGAEVRFPLTAKIKLRLRGDIGGFGVGSSLSGQLEPLLDWRVAKHVSLQFGYRVFYSDYTTGSDRTLFRYDIVTQGLQFGATFHL